MSSGKYATWQKTLRLAWKQAHEAEVVAEDFLQEVKLVTLQDASEPVSVIHNSGCNWETGEIPSDSEINKFYLYARGHKSSLEKRLGHAQIESSAERSAEYVFLISCLAYFIRKRMECLFDKANHKMACWQLLNSLRLENCDRMFDITTWQLIAHYTTLVSLKSADWMNTLCYVVRRVYCCAPEPFHQSRDYKSCRLKEKVFNKSAYNKRNSSWPNLRDIVLALNEVGGLADTVRVAISSRDREKGLDALNSLKSLLRVPNLGVFNIQECIWHLVMVRELTVREHCLYVRRNLFADSSWGPGGLNGIRTFFPQTTANGANDNAAILIGDLKSMHGVSVMQKHAIQWLMCVFQKTLNPAYKRVYQPFPKPASYFGQWHIQCESYPEAKEIFGAITKGFQVQKPWLQFLKFCKEVHEAIAFGLNSTVGCRLCFSNHGIEATVRGKLSHAYFQNIEGCGCMEKPLARKRKRQWTLDVCVITLLLASYAHQ